MTVVVSRKVGCALSTVAACALLGSGCGADGEGEAIGTVSDVVASTIVVDDTTAADGSSSTTEAGGGEDPDAGGSSPGEPRSGAGDPLPDDELPGDGFEGFAQAGDQLTVVGVAHDDVLNMRRGPGTSFAVVTELGPVGEMVEATGRARLLTRSLWYEITTGAATGWVNAGFLAYPGSVEDVTSEVIESMGEPPQGPTVMAVGRAVAEERASTDVTPRIVVAAAPAADDPGSVTCDVVGLADDAVLGYRLRILVTPDDSGDRFTLASVEQMSLCGRGLDDEARCL
jgi:uncharacterized protein YraI